MLCPNCGRELTDHEAICPDCGTALPQEAAQAQPLQEEPDLPADSVTEAPTQPEEAPEAQATEPEDMEDTQATEPEDTEDTQAPEPEDMEDTEAPEDVEDSENAEGTAEAETTQETEDTEEPEEAPPSGKKRSPLAIVLGAIIGLLLIVVVCLTITLTTLSKTGSMPGFITAITERLHQDSFDPDASAVVVVNADGTSIATLTNAEFSYYYWGEYYYYIQNSGFSFDASQPLEEQQYSDTMTWQDYFVQSACTSIQQIQALKAAAAEAGFTMPQDYQSQYDSTISSMADYAQQAGFTDEEGNGDVLAYIRDSYGESATQESFQQYLYDSYFVTAYSNELYNSLTFTDAEIEAYYDDNADTFTAYGIEKSDQPNVNVRHILIQPADTSDSEEDSDSAAEAVSEEAAWADAKAEAERIYKEWEAGEATEESFGELANTYSTDGGSNTAGGLYENVYPGQMTEEFNDWCFDTSRKAGDTAIVKTSYGYHIMYYVGATDSYYWKTSAEQDLRYQTYNDKLTELMDGCGISTADTLAITTPTAISTIQANASSSGTTTDTADTADTAADSAVG